MWKILSIITALLAILAGIWEWWPRSPLPTNGLIANTPRIDPKIATPFLDNWDQVPLAEMESQAARFAGQVWLAGPTHRKMVALTFDDGPASDTGALLDVLDKHQVKATFFWQGKLLPGHDELILRAFKAGHTLANHSFDHPDLAKLDNNYVWDEQMAVTQQHFRRILGVAPTLMRPPYGHISDTQIGLMQKHGLAVILWSLDTQDWNKNRMLFGKHHIERAVQDYLHEEAIILMHDGGGKRGKTVAAVDALIPWIKASGYEMVTVDKLLGINKPYQM